MSRSSDVAKREPPFRSDARTSLIVAAIYGLGGLVAGTWANNLGFFLLAMLGMVAFVVMGVLYYRKGNVLDQRWEYLRLNGRRVPGRIIAFVGTHQKQKGETLQQAIVEGDDGGRYQSWAFRFSLFNWGLGDRIMVLVNPDDPTDAMVDIVGDYRHELPPSATMEAIDDEPEFRQLPAAPQEDDHA